MKNKIFIVTGEIKTGKTTRLMKWTSTQKNIDGILQPIIEEKRFIYHISTRTLKPLETNSKENIISIGKYNFSNETFEWCKKIINETISKNLDWIIVDEIGPLELNGKGLEPSFSNLLSQRNNIDSKILVVVRKEILEKFLLHYNLSEVDYTIFNLE
jgi:nucleoside-triphosphatase THEP1